MVFCFNYVYVLDPYKLEDHPNLLTLPKWRPKRQPEPKPRPILVRNASLFTSLHELACLVAMPRGFCVDQTRSGSFSRGVGGMLFGWLFLVSSRKKSLKNGDDMICFR